jgi:prepilin-type N-terminal cleavage/methylation domain-containing protein
MSKTDGFTLMELMVVVAVIAIVATVSVAGYSQLIEGTRLSASASDIKSDLELAKLTAIRQHTTVLAYFNGGSYTLRANGESPFLTRTMPSKVVMSKPADPTEPISFNTLGLAENTGSVQLTTSDNAKYKRITVSAAGTVTMQRSTDGTNWEG